MKKNKFFYHTIANVKFHNLLIEASKLSISKKLKLKEITSKQVSFSHSPSLNLIFFLIKNTLNLKLFFTHQFILLKYKDCDIGRYAASVSFRSNKILDNQLYKVFILIKNIIKSGLIIDNALKIVKSSHGIYVEHVCYFGALYIKIFSKFNKIVYFNGWPRGFAVIDYRKKQNLKIQDSRIIRITPSKKKINNQIYSIATKKVEGIINQPKKNLYYMKYAPYSKNIKKRIRSIDFENIEYLIYAHSFVDGQLDYGYDGFANLHEWLEFTIKHLIKRKKKFIVKGHPNFFNKTLGAISEQDLIIFRKLKDKYSSEQVIFIDEPVQNSLIFNKLLKKTIILSHHGTAILEATHMGYKSICSVYSLWDQKFNISNQWSTKNQYIKLLNLPYKNLKLYSSKAKFLDLIYQLYFNEFGYYRKRNFHTIIEKHAKNLDRKKIKLNHNDILKHIKKDKIKVIINTLAKNIEEINL